MPGGGVEELPRDGYRAGHGLEEWAAAVGATADDFAVGFGEEFREVCGCGPGGEAGGDGEVVVGSVVCGLGVVAGELEEFLFEQRLAVEGGVAFERLGRQQ